MQPLQRLINALGSKRQRSSTVPARPHGRAGPAAVPHGAATGIHGAGAGDGDGGVRPAATTAVSGLGLRRFNATSSSALCSAGSRPARGSDALASGLGR